jgi:hypothetical protein
MAVKTKTVLTIDSVEYTDLTVEKLGEQVQFITDTGEVLVTLSLSDLQALVRVITDAELTKV